MKQTDNFQFNLTSLASKRSTAKYWWLRAACGLLVCLGLMLPEAKAQSPGGVTTAFNLWLKANIGVTTTTGQVTTWADQIGTSITTQATATASADITLNANEANFNPTVKFTGASGKELVGLASSNWNTAALTMFIVAKDEGTTTNIAGVFATGATGVSPGQGVVWVTGGTYQLDGSGCTSAATTGTLGQYRIIRAVYSSPTNTNGGTMWVDGKQTGTGINCGTTGGANFEIGGRIHGSLPDRIFKGGIAEVLASKQSFTATELQRIESYLAIKYGVTLDQTAATDYLASDGTTKMWDAATGATFNNDIAGIGRDDGSALNQKQSKSINPDAIISMGLGTIAADNASNANAFGADKTFFSWANNNASADFSGATTTGLPSAAMNARLTRVWKAQEPQTDVGNLSIKANLVGTGFSVNRAAHVFLLISGSATDFSGATVVNATSYANGVATFDGVNLSNGQFFTIGAYVTSPGGVSAGLSLWSKAGFGITATGNNVSAWADHANNNSFTMNGDPQTGATAINFNNTIDFDGTGDYFTGSKSITFAEVFAGVAQTGSTGRVIGGNVATGSNCGAYFFGSLDRLYVGDADAATDYISVPKVTGFNLLNAELKGGANTDSRIAVNGLDGTPVNGAGANNGLAPFSGNPILGNCNALNGALNGNVGELIVYSAGLSAANRQKVNSYLALKYGVTLDQTTATDYLASDGTTKMWDGTVSAAYKNNIAGIGRDDLSALNQKQSKSIATGTVVTMGLGNIAASNVANTGAFGTDKQFMVWSNDGTETDISNAITTQLPSQANARMKRVWRIEENNGDVGNVEVQFNITNLGFSAASKDQAFLLVSSSATDFSGATVITANSLAGGVASFTNVNFTDGQFFTFAAFVTGPGGVSNGLQVWLKANQGTSTTTDGANISQWNDGANGKNATQNTAVNQPLFKSDAASLINYNPVVRFNNGAEFDQLLIGGGAYDTRDAIFVMKGNIDGYQAIYDNVGTTSGTESDNDGIFVNSNGLGLDAASWNYNTGTNGTVAGKYYVNAKETNALASNTTPYLVFVDKPQVENDTYMLNSNGGGFNYWAGDLPEFIVFKTDLSATERQRIQSYLALKYGITQDQTAATDYLASDGTTKMWDGTVSVAYKNNIAGIGRDDASVLNQKQSKSINSGSIVTMGLGTIAADNVSNTNTFATDKAFLVWSDNGGSTDFANVTTTNLPVGVNGLMARVWRVEENNGDVGNTQIKVDLTGLNFPGTAKDSYVLLVSADGANFSGATNIKATSFASNTLTFDNVNLADNQFFTIGYICAPFLAGKLSISQVICSGNTPNQFTSITDASGEGTITYQWQSSSDNATWANIAGATNKDYQAGALTTITYFRRVATSSVGLCGSVNSEVIKVDITSQVPPSVSISANVADGIICEGTSVTFTAATRRYFTYLSMAGKQCQCERRNQCYFYLNHVEKR